MRNLFYTLAGLVSTVIGWFLSQLLLDIYQLSLPDIAVLPDYFIMLPVVTACLASSMVVSEIFLSHPTRFKANRRVFAPYFWGALVIGLLSGIVSASLIWILINKAGVSEQWLRIVAWSLVGLFTGLGESWLWKSRTIEGGDYRRANQRLKKSTLFGFIAGLSAAFLLEIIRDSITDKGYEDPLGFLLLGFVIGLSLSFATAPTCQMALRPGKGFEQQDSPNCPNLGTNSPLIRLENRNGSSLYIEEGVPILFPDKTTKPILIGADKNADLYLPHIPTECAKLVIKNREFKLTCLADRSVEINYNRLPSGDSYLLKHNDLLTFYHENYIPSDDEEKQLYRFVFYDRFLDPQA